MKPDWDRLMKEFKDSETALVADVDCTADGKALCTKVGVKGYPTLKYGDPNNLEDYKGGRTYDELLEFASENLGPTCGPGNMDLCDDEQKKKIESIMALGLEKIEEQVEKMDGEIKGAEEFFETEVKKLQERYETLSKEKDDAIKAAKDKDLGLMKTVRAHMQATKAGHDEL